VNKIIFLCLLTGNLLFYTTTLPYNTQPIPQNKGLPENIKRIVQISRGGNQSSSPYTKEEIDLLAHLVHAEAEGEPFEGKIAIVQVVLNRLKDEKFPKTIKEVIYQKNQFESVNNGRIKLEWDQSDYDAVMKALNGANVVGDSIFFFEPKRVKNSKRVIGYSQITKQIGKHLFAK